MYRGELARCADLLAFQLGKETTGQHLGSGSAAAAAVRRLLGFSFVSLCQGRAITTCWTRGRGTCQYQPRAARCSKLQDNICSNTSVLVGKAQESSEYQTGFLWHLSLFLHHRKWGRSTVEMNP